MGSQRGQNSDFSPISARDAIIRKTADRSCAVLEQEKSEFSIERRCSNPAAQGEPPPQRFVAAMGCALSIFAHKQKLAEVLLVEVAKHGGRDFVHLAQHL